MMSVAFLMNGFEDACNDMIPFASLLAIMTMGVGFLWLTPYIQTAEASFYEEIKRDYELNGGLD